MHPDTQKIGGHEFWLVGTLAIQRSGSGELIEYSHPLPAGERRNRYADGPFCRFGLPSAPHAEGVYAVIVDSAIQYVGECADLAQRYSAAGYGLISPRNCHHDGQSTNCKLNARVLAAAKTGSAAQVWFRASNDRKALEAELIASLRPPWNGRVATTRADSDAPSHGSPRIPAAASPQVARSPTREDDDFRKALNARFVAAEAEGLKLLQVGAGSLHREAGGYPGPRHRMPSCCAAMRATMQQGDRIVNAPPKGNGASVIIEFRLPRK
ncbi:hypothetical protein BH09GEM1_BH09GEM1_07440 [soil metagenome]